MELYLVRHGQSEGNVGNPDPDPALTPLGRQQAAITAAYLRRFPIELVLSSPLRRAMETGAIIAQKLDLPHEVYPDLVEKDGGDKQAETDFRKILERFPSVSPGLGMGQGTWDLPLNENHEEAYARAKRVEKLIRDRWQGTESQVLIVSHGTFGAILIGAILGAPICSFTRFSQHNCCHSQFEILPDSVKLRCLNRICHLPEEMWT